MAKYPGTNGSTQGEKNDKAPNDELLARALQQIPETLGDY